MTSWLKWRLCALLGTSLLVGGATYLHAQNEYPAPAKTPEEAGAQFFQLLNSMHSRSADFEVYEATNSAVGSAMGVEDTASTPFNGAISRAQFEALNASSVQFHQLMERFFQKANERQYNYDARVAEMAGNQTIVEVTPRVEPKARDVVVITEDGGYRVDLKATYGLWNERSGTQLDEDWYRYSGVASPALRQSPNFLRSQCQTQLKQQMLGILMYTQDYDERLPPARKWMDVLQPYIKIQSGVNPEQTFRCPSLTGGGYGYAYNQYLDQFPVWKLESPAALVNVYECDNPSRNWFGRGTGRAFRHLEGWNLAFNDGHVKWFKGNGASGPSGVEFKPTLQKGNNRWPGAPSPAPPPPAAVQ